MLELYSCKLNGKSLSLVYVIVIDKAEPYHYGVRLGVIGIILLLTIIPTDSYINRCETT